MKVFTSYFGNVKRISKKFPDSFVFVSIARRSPSGFSGTEYQRISPSPELLMDYKNGRCRNELRLVPFPLVRKDLERFSDGKDLILLCWEKYPDFCHRYLVSDWLKEHGIYCEEFLLTK